MVQIYGKITDTVKKNTKSLIGTDKEVGLELNIDKVSTCCCLITRMNIKIWT
jgi:hypothetical protein